MTDGCAGVIEFVGNSAMKEEVFPRLISRDPSKAYTSGQWMTERPCRSDVSQTETTARTTSMTHQFGSVYKLNGFKWFSSATDSNVALALAETGSIQEGSRALSLFLIPLRLSQTPTHLNLSPVRPSPGSGILVYRLKNEIGTHILPTAELSLNDTEGYLIGPLNQGPRA